MLYDLFICHASEDKDEFVRPLAERLKQERTEVWYDEFSLTPGDSLRRSIDRGLSKSRYGVVVLSANFFAKEWPQWELDGLVQRQLSAGQRVIIPVWYGITHDEVLKFSPPIADLVAIQAHRGLDHVVDEIMQVVHPDGSTLLIARDLVIRHGYDPPVVTDDWWLEVVEQSGSNDLEGGFQEAMGWGRWGFPLPDRSRDPGARGERIAWAALQMLWQAEEDRRPVTQITHPDEVHAFLRSQPGLMERALEFPHYVASYAPQLTIPGLGGPLESVFEAWLKDALAEGDGERLGCPTLLALRHPKFGNHDPAVIACLFVQGETMSSGPPVRFYPTMDYVAWFLSNASSWLPEKVHAFLLEGLKRWGEWLWYHHGSDFAKYDGAGALSKEMIARSRKNRRILGKRALQDLQSRLAVSARDLNLPESAAELTSRFLNCGFIEAWHEEQGWSRSLRRRLSRYKIVGRSLSRFP